MSEPFDGIYAGKRIFVTGHTGFKGSWLALWLKELGASVTGYSWEPPTNPSHFEVASVRQDLDGHHIGDIRDEERMFAAMQACDPDIILHLAAQTVVKTGYLSPRETFDINVMGTISVLECVRRLNKPVTVLCVTSDKCYENREQIWGYRETDAFGDHDPYGGSKGAAEIAIRSYRHSFFHPSRIAEHGVKLTSARAGNVIGGGDWTANALIVDLVHSLIEGRAVELRNPSAYRPWQHVLQALSGYLTLVSKAYQAPDGRFCTGYNIGPLSGNELSVQEVTEEFISRWGSGSWVDGSTPGQVHEATLLHLSIDKAMRELGWKPSWDVREAIGRTVEWFQHFCYESEPVRLHSIRQIRDYQEAMAAGRRGTGSAGSSDNANPLEAVH
ncbi:CDP-glucose 4,6-dehydratase [Rubinisphaera margarita]|uniref:CDP-glucose 4,6-dehydratase n=1 Tax=Rubinisphaera margarita TaxID=2909586 RepID=UPI001EE8AD9F|nr:CDP-glucose 4,6-dehydratase [Rubinisphaera margarita]MCG6155272.1 CDP-glucose 4,6-dehydratase [Rubinisphaera margarita]